MFTTEQSDRLKESLSTGKARYDKLARVFATTEMAIRNFDIEVCGRWVTSPDGWGPLSLRPHAVARRHIDGEWDNRSERIKEARWKYDKGLTEMCSGRDGYWIILYSLPRKEVDEARRLYFSRDFGRG
jgi:hypothetical protein